MTTYSIGAQRAIAITEIDRAAEDARGQRISGITGQDMVYAEKRAQAQAYIAAHAASPDAEVPGYVAAEMAATGSTALQAAQAITAAAAAFHAGAGPQIEQARRAGKLAVQAATTAEGIADAKASALQALQSI